MTEAILPSASAQADTRAAPAAYFSCRNLHAYYGQSYVVQGVSFDVREGEIVAATRRSPSGCKLSPRRC